MVISQLKEEIFELRRNQIHFDKVTQMVQTLEERCKTFEREKVGMSNVRVSCARAMRPRC
jgi:uncharacterized protein YdcH (DUF465 family)